MLGEEEEEPEDREEGREEEGLILEQEVGQVMGSLPFFLELLPEPPSSGEREMKYLLWYKFYCIYSLQSRLELESPAKEDQEDTIICTSLCLCLHVTVKLYTTRAGANKTCIDTVHMTINKNL